MKICDGLLGDLSGYKSVHRDAMELVDELHNWNQEAFAEWSRDMIAQIDDKNAPLRLAGCSVTVSLIFHILCIYTLQHLQELLCIYSFNEKGASVDKPQLDTRLCKHLN